MVTIGTENKVALLADELIVHRNININNNKQGRVVGENPASGQLMSCTSAGEAGERGGVVSEILLGVCLLGLWFS